MGWPPMSGTRAWETREAPAESRAVVATRATTLSSSISRCTQVLLPTPLPPSSHSRTSTRRPSTPPCALRRAKYALAPSRGPVKALPPTGLVALVTMPTRIGVSSRAGVARSRCSKSLSGSRLPHAVPTVSSRTARAASAARKSRRRGIAAQLDQRAQGVDRHLPGAVLFDRRSGGVRQGGGAVQHQGVGHVGRGGLGEPDLRDLRLHLSAALVTAEGLEHRAH